MAKILMIQFQAEPYAGTAYLCGAVCSSGHEFVLKLVLNKNDEIEVLKELNHINPDLIGFSCMTGFHNKAISLAMEIKKQYVIPIIMGGPHPTLFPNVIEESSIDMICRGEGEFPLIELMNNIKDKEKYKNIKNLYVKENNTIIKNPLRNLVEPLDNLPLVDWSCYKDTIVQKASPMAFLIRGCPYSCTYCFNEGMRNMYKGLGTYVRKFSVDRSIKEIQQALKIFYPNPLLFSSDTFGIDTVWMEELFQKYSKLTDLPFILLLRPELASEKVVNILGKYKCHAVAIGVESGSERVRKEILHRNYSNNLLVEVAERLHKVGIKFRTYNIIGIPGESETEMLETVDINIKMKTDFPRCAIFVPFPDTEIVKNAISLSLLDNDFSFDSIPNSILSHSILKYSQNYKNKIQNTMYFFQSMVLFPWVKWFFSFLSKLKPNIIYRLWFYFIYANLHRNLEKRSLFSYIIYAYMNRQNVISQEKKK